eukprot:1968348-Rhodomonas_salina.4
MNLAVTGSAGSIHAFLSGPLTRSHCCKAFRVTLHDPTEIPIAAPEENKNTTRLQSKNTREHTKSPVYLALARALHAHDTPPAAVTPTRVSVSLPCSEHGKAR